jgi:uracil phosphoribosyltransferase
MAIPKNAHISTHPCLQAKLSQLRSASTGCRDAQTLVHEIALMVGYEALGSALKAQEAGTVCLTHATPLSLVSSVGKLQLHNATQHSETQKQLPHTTILQ